MIRTVVVLLALCHVAYSSGVGHHHLAAPVGLAPIGVAPLAPAGIVTAPAAVPAPYVAAHSSQYFERTFNRLVATPLVPQPLIPVAPVAPPPVFVEPVTRTVPIPVTPTQNVPVQAPTQHVDPNIAIAIATAHAANPVATILLPPYPFAPPPNFGFVHPIVVPEVQQNATTTTTAVTSTTVREPEPTTPLPAPTNTDNSFAQLPTNQNTNIQQVYGPPELPRPFPSAKPQKLKTSVEVVPVPLAYIAPPSIPHHQHHYHHHHGHRPVKYVHSFVPAKLIVRPVHVHSVRVPLRLVVHKVPVRNVQRSQRVLTSRVGSARDVEPTTFKPFRPVSRPPKL